MFYLMEKYRLQENSKKLDKSRFGNIFRQLRLVDNQLEKLQATILRDLTNSKFQNSQTVLIKKRSDLLSYNNTYPKKK